MAKRVVHIIVWIVSLSVLNSSIGIPGINASDFALNTQSLSNWNEFESIYEWVAEDVLHIKNAVPEQHTKHANQHGVAKKFSPVFIGIRLQKEPLHQTVNAAVTETLAETGNHKPLAGYITLFSPPPNA